MLRRLALAVSIPVACLAGLCCVAQGAFPGANGRIAFTRDPGVGVPDTPGRVFGINPDGTGLLPITDGSKDSEPPRWSPNGQQIAYAAPGSADPNRLRVWVANADGSAPHEVAPPAPGVIADDFAPSWSPDGKRLVFDRQIYDASMMVTSENLMVGNADGTGAAVDVPTTDTGADIDPAWSPDGGRLAVAHYTGGNPAYVIQVLNLDGSGRHTVDTPPMNRMDANPSWSPDGSTVWFNRGLPAVGCSSQSQIYAAPASGPAGVLISKDPSVSEYETAPSPDGTEVAFVRCDDPTDGVHHIYTMSTVGLNAHPVTSGATVDDYLPDWQPTAPQFSSSPSISGRSVDNATLTASAGSASPGSTALQFLRCDAKGASCVPIPGAGAARAHGAASSVSYKLTSTDLGHAIRVRQTQTNPAGSSSADSPATKSVIPSKGHCSNRFAGTAKADKIKGSAGSDRISGGRGRDRLSGLAGADCISGGAGNDKLSGGRGNDTLSGGAGNDTIAAGPGRNRVSGGAGNDRINVRNHKRDVVNCGKGRKDRVIADKRDKLRGCEKIRRLR